MTLKLAKSQKQRKNLTKVCNLAKTSNSFKLPAENANNDSFSKKCYVIFKKCYFVFCFFERF